MRTENLYQYQTETRRLAKVLKPFPASESQFRFKNFYEKSSITKAFLSVSVVPSKSRKSIENICDKENSRIYVASCTLKGSLSSRWLARSFWLTNSFKKQMCHENPLEKPMKNVPRLDRIEINFGNTP